MRSKNIKKLITILLTTIMALSLAACSTKEEYDPTDDLCPGKQIGVDGTAPTLAEGFDPNVDMSFTTVDTKGTSVTNEIFAGIDRGVWLVFWRTDSEKSQAELARLDGLVDTAAKNGYKILGVVMDGEKNTDKAAKMTADLKFDNIIWNDSMALRCEGIDRFFTKEFYEENAKIFKGLDPMPALGNPVSTMTNSRGEKKLVELWQNNDSNATYEELMEQERTSMKE